ncbi:hypothetical protein A6C57_13135 [Fibrella sp. ES10-3-2-2]|nr:hypothetical protein A6C57_13135 [Fibrella sp. ES10-3-2-2]
MIHVDYIPNEFSSHEDFLVQIPELGIGGYGDTYYFADDSGILPYEASDTKVKIVIRALLTYWEEQVEALGVGQIAYLPFDVSDQSISLLQVENCGSTLLARHAWTGATGGIHVSRLDRIDFSKKEIHVYEGSVRWPTEKFLAAVRRERDKL